MLDLSEGINAAVLRKRYPAIDRPEDLYQILCQVLRGQGDQVDWSAMSGEQVEALEKIAISEEAGPFLFWTWQDAPPARIPKAVLVRLAASFLKNERRMGQVLRELKERILPALVSQAGPVIILKGGALAYAVYPHPAMRPMSDLDILVPEDQQAEAAGRLEAIGYRQDAGSPGAQAKEIFEHHHVTLSSDRPTPLVVEVHKNISDSYSDLVEAQTISWYMDHLARAQIGDDCIITTLDPTAQVMHLAIHLALRHGEAQMSLLKYYDIHLVIETYRLEIDWRELAEQARVQNRAAALYTALAGCVARFGTPIDAGWMRQLKDSIVEDLPTREVIQKSMPHMAGATNQVYLTNVLFALKRPQSMTGRARLLRELLLPSPEYIHYRYRPKPRWLWPFYYIVRFFRIFLYLRK